MTDGRIKHFAGARRVVIKIGGQALDGLTVVGGRDVHRDEVGIDGGALDAWLAHALPTLGVRARFAVAAGMTNGEYPARLTPHPSFCASAQVAHPLPQGERDK